MRRSITEYPTNGHKRSLREIAVEVESAGFVTRRGTRYGGRRWRAWSEPDGPHCDQPSRVRRDRQDA